ncbi:DNA-3-methyladenine glycosylase family protein [Antrihabitans stalactiti]|uniref:DNA-3-methyladenine glycosylase II n=1 Tax=Antrihabitans stalactiti TaxID=2584121 RepID=A0A848KHN6_9NOCA|nr:DNA-3-methyladenine glycosylase 2 family protein [Antrihabitans stalactiti]NMN95417.1 DNA-3-methyladenine glycosylase 2 family protein [Antrihabitans stalactiti]
MGMTIALLRRGPGDPCHQRTHDGAVWRGSRMNTGIVTYRLTQAARNEVQAVAWGPGSAEFLDGLPSMFCLDEDLENFAPTHPKIIDAHRRFPGLRMLRTGRVLEALVPAILEQKVHGVAAFASWRKLVKRYGERAPGPAPAGLYIPPTAEVWRRVPSWEFHKANVDPKRSRAIVTAAAIADRLEETVGMSPADAERRLRTVPGVGVWTAAEVAQRALGDADALSVGDFHLAAIVGWTLAGRPFDDDEMVSYLEPLRPHRYRAIRLLEVSGHAFKPKFGPRTAVTDHSKH